MKEPCEYYGDQLLEVAQTICYPRVIPADLYLRIHEISLGLVPSKQYLDELYERFWSQFERYQVQKRDKLFGNSQIEDVEEDLKAIFNALKYLSKNY